MTNIKSQASGTYLMESVFGQCLKTRIEKHKFKLKIRINLHYEIGIQMETRKSICCLRLKNRHDVLKIV